MRTDPTAVQSPAPRYTHQNNKRTRTNPYKIWTLHLMFCVINIMALLYYVGDGGAEPCSPPANTTLATCNATTTHHGLVNGGESRCSLPKTPTITTVWSPAPRQCHYSDYSVNVTHDSAKEPHQQLGLHPVLNVTPLSLHFSQRLQTRNCRNTASLHRSTPPSPTHLAWRCRSGSSAAPDPRFASRQPGQSWASNMPSITPRHPYPGHIISDSSTKGSRSETTTRPRPQPHTDRST